MIEEHDLVVLTGAVPEVGLVAGDVGTVVFVHNHGVAFEVEFMTLTGETIAVVTLSAEQVRPIRHGDLHHVCEVETIAA